MRRSRPTTAAASRVRDPLCDDGCGCCREADRLHEEVGRLRELAATLAREREHWFRAWLGETERKRAERERGTRLPDRTDWERLRAMVGAGLSLAEARLERGWRAMRIREE
jgi:hypothetical protein